MQEPIQVSNVKRATASLWSHSRAGLSSVHHGASRRPREAGLARPSTASPASRSVWLSSSLWEHHLRRFRLTEPRSYLSRKAGRVRQHGHLITCTCSLRCHVQRAPPCAVSSTHSQTRIAQVSSSSIRKWWQDIAKKPVKIYSVVWTLCASCSNNLKLLSPTSVQHRMQPYTRTPLWQSEGRHAAVDADRCVWGFKAFDDHLTNSTLLTWLWSRLETALVLERRDGTLH